MTTAKDYLDRRWTALILLSVAEFVVVPQRVLYRVPNELPFEHAAMVEPFAIALHAIRRSPPALSSTPPSRLKKERNGRPV